MTRAQYRLLDRLVRRIDALHAEEYDIWTPIAKILIKREIALVFDALHSMFTEEQIEKIRFMQSMAKARKDKYEYHRWVSHAVLCKFDYHDEDVISRVTDKFREYDWSWRFKPSDGIPF